jgi:hypothetical protein
MDSPNYTNCKSVPLDKFISFYNTEKISDSQYKIVEIIKRDLYVNKVIEVGDIISVNDWWITYKITRGEEEICYGSEELYTIVNSEFEGFVDSSVEDLIDKLYTKLQGHKVIEKNPYARLEEVLRKYAK